MNEWKAWDVSLGWFLVNGIWNLGARIARLR